MTLTTDQKLEQIKALCESAELNSVVPSTFSAQHLLEMLEQIQEICQSKNTAPVSSTTPVSAIRKVISQEYQIHNSDINVVGQMLGYDWNQICDLVSDAEIYGMDGSGYYHFSREQVEGLKSPILKHIFQELFNSCPEMQNLIILDNC